MGDTANATPESRLGAVNGMKSTVWIAITTRAKITQTTAGAFAPAGRAGYRPGAGPPNEVRRHVLTAGREQALKPGESFHECAKGCPEMVVVRAGTFQMGSPDTEKGRWDNEGPQHEVLIAQAFAVGKFDVTWDEWDLCVRMHGCDGRPTSDAGYGRDKMPVINISWDQASTYAEWLSHITGRKYRLLTEAEWEYAARAGTQTAYNFGDDAREICMYANGGDQSLKRYGGRGEVADCDDHFAFTSPVDTFPPNKFGLYDTHGNVRQWVEDCWHDNYNGAPSDGSAWTIADCASHVVRGNSWFYTDHRSAFRAKYNRVTRDGDLGFRMGRTLTELSTVGEGPT